MTRAPPVPIRRYDPADWAAIAAIHDRARLGELALTVGTDAFRSLAETFESEGLFDGVVDVAEVAGAIAGFVAFDPGEITWLYVDPDRLRRGVGRALVRHAVGELGGDADVWVLHGNHPAIALYAACGFAVVETRDGGLAGLPDVPARGYRLRRMADPFVTDDMRR